MLPARALARPVSGSPARTRERLLEAAERLFAERGFSATSVRALTSEARSNVASVNYHFGGKEGLYREMFRRRLVALREQRIAGIRRAMDETGGRASLELTLGPSTTPFLGHPLDQGAGRRLMRPFLPRPTSPHPKPAPPPG